MMPIRTYPSLRGKLRKIARRQRALAAGNEITDRHVIMFAAAAVVALFFLSLQAAFAQAVAMRLRPIATVEVDIVRLGDLVDGLGINGEAAVFAAPQPGASGIISASRILAAARENGIHGIDPGGLSSVTVRRLGRRITAEDVTRAITAALINEHQLGKDTEVEINAGLMEVTVESTAIEPLVIRNLNYNGGSGRFEATFVVPGSRAMELNPGRVVGNVADVMRVPVLSRPILKGDLVGASDISMERRRRSDLGGDIYLDPAKIVGNAARRALPRGTLLREADIQRPEIVEKNATVTMLHEQPGIQLSMRGKAISGGAMGDVIQVMNINSKRTVEATITGPNRVAVTGTVLPQKSARTGNAIQ
jgi:flagellar basal body P-ring formation protein FlgA